MNIGVIFAGGVGKRMNSRVKPKQFLNVYGKPIIIHTLEVFDSHPDIDAIVVACLEEWIPYLQKLIVGVDRSLFIMAYRQRSRSLGRKNL